MAVWVPWARVLVAGDYLSPVEIPMLSETGSLSAYLATLDRLEPLVEQADHVVPGPRRADRRHPRRGDPARGPRLPAGAARARGGGEAAARAAHRPRSARSTPRTRRAGRALMHELTPELRALGEAVLAAALERLAADPPDARAHAAAGRGARRWPARR